MGATVTALVTVIDELQTQIGRLETELADRFERHPDAEIIRPLPRLGMTLSARVLSEFGDDPNRYATAKCRQNLLRHVTQHPGLRQAPRRPGRYARNKRLADACELSGRAEAISGPPELIRIHPDRVRSWGLEHAV